MSNVVAFDDKATSTQLEQSPVGRCLCGARRHHQFLFSARRVVSERIRAASNRARSRRHRHRRPQQRRGRRARLSRARGNEGAFPVEHGVELPPFKLIVGARLVFADGTPDILAYPQNRTAWGRLTRLFPSARAAAESRVHSLSRRPARAHRRAQSHRDAASARSIQTRCNRRCSAQQLKSVAASASVWLAASMLYRGDDAAPPCSPQGDREHTFVPLIAMNDVLYHAPERRALQDVVTCIREHVTIDKAGRLLEANAERHLKSSREMTRLFRRAPEAIDRTLRFLDRCNFSLDELEKTEYPTKIVTDMAIAARGTQGSRRERSETALSERSPRRYVTRSIANWKSPTIAYAKYFLTVHRHRQLCALQRHPVPGARLGGEFRDLLLPRHHRGRSREVDLLFERFVSEERKEPPDIDVDFEHERREEVIQHIYNKYGRHHAEPGRDRHLLSRT